MFNKPVKFTILIGNSGTDKVCITLNLPSATFPFDENNLLMSFEVAKGNAIDYVKKHFESDLTANNAEVINTATGEKYKL